MKKSYRILIGVFILASAVTLTYFLLRQKKNSEYVSPKQGPIAESIYGLGIVKSKKIFEYKVGLATYLSEIFVAEGDLVKKGQPLLRVDSGGIVRAPFAGTVVQLPFHEGENVFTGTTLVRIEDPLDRFVEVSLEQHGALRVKKNQSVEMSFESFRNQKFQGLVETAYPSSGQFIVRIKPADLVPAILPGMSVDVAIIVSQKSDAFLVPTRAIQAGQVVVERNGKQQKVPVKIGLSDDEWTEIVEPQISITENILVPRK